MIAFPKVRGILFFILAMIILGIFQLIATKNLGHALA